MSWVKIENLNDDDKIYSGALIRYYNKEKEFEDSDLLLVEPLDYIISPIFDNSDYFQLMCLSAGEEGNITCILKCEKYYTLGAEIKKMLISDLYKVFINKNPKIIIE